MDLCSLCSFPLKKLSSPGLQWQFPPPPPPYLFRTVHLRFQFVPQSKWYYRHTNLGGPADVYCYRWEGPLPGRCYFFWKMFFAVPCHEPNFLVLNLYISVKAWDTYIPLKTETQHRWYGCKHTREMSGQFGRAVWCSQNTHLSWKTS